MKRLIRLYIIVHLFALSNVSDVFAQVESVSAYRAVLRKVGLIPKSDVEASSLYELDDILGFFLRSLNYYVGVFILAVIVYAGFIWATAAGNEEKIKRAKSIILYAVIGLGILILSSFILSFILDLTSGVERSA